MQQQLRRAYMLFCLVGLFLANAGAYNYKTEARTPKSIDIRIADFPVYHTHQNQPISHNFVLDKIAELNFPPYSSVPDLAGYSRYYAGVSKTPNYYDFSTTRDDVTYLAQEVPGVPAVYSEGVKYEAIYAVPSKETQSFYANYVFQVPSSQYLPSKA